MADKKLNEVTANATVDYVIGTLNDGSTVRISKADLAAVVGGLLVQNNVIFGVFGVQDDVDADNLLKNGTYYLRNNIQNAMSWSYLVVFKIYGTDNIIQININSAANQFKIRTKTTSGWQSWKTIPLQ